MSDSTAGTRPTDAAHLASARRLLVLALLSIPAAFATVWDEILLAGPIIFLTETLGFAGGLLAFIAIWGSLGIGALVAIDYVSPLLSRALSPLLERFGGGRGGASSLGWLAPAGIALTLTGAAAGGVAAAFFHSEATGWLNDHREDLAMFFAAAAVIFLLLLLVDRVTRGIEAWVKRVAESATGALRQTVALIAMVVLGPVLGWSVFRLMRYSRRSTYGLTLLAAPVFGAIWVPFYSLGIWRIIQRWL